MRNMFRHLLPAPANQLQPHFLHQVLALSNACQPKMSFMSSQYNQKDLKKGFTLRGPQNNQEGRCAKEVKSLLETEAYARQYNYGRNR
jgi:hypothetical protein